MNVTTPGIAALALFAGLTACRSAQAPAAAPTVRVTTTVTPTPTVATTSPQIIINNNNNAAPAPTQTVTVPAPAQPATSGGCPVGYVCTYTVAGWQNQQPEREYYDYGCYEMREEFGTKVIVNNQTDGATATGYGSNGCVNSHWAVQAQSSLTINMTPIYSISLTP